MMSNENESLKEFYKHVAGKHRYRFRDAFLRKFIDRWCHFQYQGKKVSGIFHRFYPYDDSAGSSSQFEILLRKVYLDGKHHGNRMSFEYQFIVVDGKVAETVEDFIFDLFPRMCLLKKNK